MKVFRLGTSPERAQREIEAMLQCAHPNIARLTSVDTHTIGSDTYLISFEEFLCGGTLSQRLQSGGLLATADTRSIGAALISAVAHVASLDLVHRDIKTDNVMLRADGNTPVLVDFGLVRDLSAASLTQTWLLQGPGTPLFAPAEQLHNEKALIDWRADQFSLGALLSISAFGFHPYDNGDDLPIDIVARVSSRSQPTQRFRDAAMAAGLPVLIKMTAPWPVERFRRPDELLSAWTSQPAPV